MKVPCMYMRGGTSKGPFFDMRDLPEDVQDRDQFLLSVMGSPDPRQIDGLGGAETVTSKVVMVAPSERPGIDVDYLFAQVSIDAPIVDTSPPCGNMMAGVGPFAIERGMVAAQEGETRVMIYNLNTDATIEAVVQTPGAVVEYTGDSRIDGVRGTAAPLLLNLFDQVGGKTGKLFPSGESRQMIQGVQVSLLDAGTVMMLIAAADLGLTGDEDRAFFSDQAGLMEKIESMRREAGKLMGMGDVSDSVLPKVGILSEPAAGGSIRSRYLTPHALHPAHAVSGAICIATAALSRETVASDLAVVESGEIVDFTLEHPSGSMAVRMETAGSGDTFTVHKAGVLRSVRKIMDGFVFA